MDLENAARSSSADGGYSLSLGPGSPVVDWEPLVRAILEDLSDGAGPSTIATRFHDALAELAVTIAHAAGLERVALSGGCFQNALLTEAVVERLALRGFEVYVPERFPPNDGGLSLGQAWVAASTRAEESRVSRHPR